MSCIFEPEITVWIEGLVINEPGLAETKPRSGHKGGFGLKWQWWVASWGNKFAVIPTPESRCILRVSGLVSDSSLTLLRQSHTLSWLSGLIPLKQKSWLFQAIFRSWSLAVSLRDSKAFFRYFCRENSRLSSGLSTLLCRDMKGSFCSVGVASLEELCTRLQTAIVYHGSRSSTCNILLYRDSLVPGYHLW